MAMLHRKRSKIHRVHKYHLAFEMVTVIVIQGKILLYIKLDILDIVISVGATALRTN